MLNYLVGSRQECLATLFSILVKHLSERWHTDTLASRDTRVRAGLQVCRGQSLVNHLRVVVSLTDIL
jgi:hypothetical protein